MPSGRNAERNKHANTATNFRRKGFSYKGAVESNLPKNSVLPDKKKTNDLKEEMVQTSAGSNKDFISSSIDTISPSAKNESTGLVRKMGAASLSNQKTQKEASADMNSVSKISEFDRLSFAHSQPLVSGVTTVTAVGQEKKNARPAVASAKDKSDFPRGGSMKGKGRKSRTNDNKNDSSSSAKGTRGYEKGPRNKHEGMESSTGSEVTGPTGRRSAKEQVHGKNSSSKSKKPLVEFVINGPAKGQMIQAAKQALLRRSRVLLKSFGEAVREVVRVSDKLKREGIAKVVRITTTSSETLEPGLFITLEYSKNKHAGKGGTGLGGGSILTSKRAPGRWSNRNRHNGGPGGSEYFARRHGYNNHFHIHSIQQKHLRQPHDPDSIFGCRNNAPEWDWSRIFDGQSESDKEYARKYDDAQAFCNAAGSGRLKEVTRYLVNGACPNIWCFSNVYFFGVYREGDYDKMSPLHKAAQNGHVGVVWRLCQSGANVNLRSAAGMTALHLAAENNHSDVMRKLLLCPATDVNATNSRGCTALHLAVDIDSPILVKMLLEYGADVHANTFDDAPPAMKDGEGSGSNAMSSQATLSQAGSSQATALVASHDGFRQRSQPLHFVLSEKVTQLLLQHGASVSAKDKLGRTPLQTALMRDFWEVSQKRPLFRQRRGSFSCFRNHMDKLHTLHVLVVGGCTGRRLMHALLLGGIPRVASGVAPALRRLLKSVHKPLPHPHARRLLQQRWEAQKQRQHWERPLRLIWIFLAEPPVEATASVAGVALLLRSIDSGGMGAHRLDEVCSQLHSQRNSILATNPPDHWPVMGSAPSALPLTLLPTLVKIVHSANTLSAEVIMQQFCSHHPAVSPELVLRQLLLVGIQVPLWNNRNGPGGRRPPHHSNHHHHHHTSHQRFQHSEGKRSSKGRKEKPPQSGSSQADGGSTTNSPTASPSLTASPASTSRLSPLSPPHSPMRLSPSSAPHLPPLPGAAADYPVYIWRLRRGNFANYQQVLNLQLPMPLSALDKMLPSHGKPIDPSLMTSEERYQKHMLVGQQRQGLRQLERWAQCETEVLENQLRCFLISMRYDQLMPPPPFSLNSMWFGDKMDSPDTRAALVANALHHQAALKKDTAAAAASMGAPPPADAVLVQKAVSLCESALQLVAVACKSEDTRQMCDAIRLLSAVPRVVQPTASQEGEILGSFVAKLLFRARFMQQAWVTDSDVVAPQDAEDDSSEEGAKKIVSAVEDVPEPATQQRSRRLRRRGLAITTPTGGVVIAGRSQGHVNAIIARRGIHGKGAAMATADAVGVEIAGASIDSGGDKE